MQFPSRNPRPAQVSGLSSRAADIRAPASFGEASPGQLAGTRQFQILVGVAATLIAVAVLAIGLTIWALRVDAVQDTSRDVGHVATILAAQTAQSVKAIDAMLIDFGQHLSAAEKLDPTGFATTLRSRQLHQELADRTARLPQGAIFAVVSAAGHTIADSKDWPAIDINDREYFIVHKANASGGLYINPLVKSRGDGAKMLFFSRRLAADDGTFLGILVIGLDVGYFRHMYNALGSLPDLSFLFLRSDGTVLLRYPDAIDRAGDKLPNGSPWYDAVAHGSGYFRSEGYFDHEPRYIAVRQVPGYPFVVNAAESEAAALAAWRHRGTMIVAGAGLMLICSGLLLWALYLQFCKLSLSQASLAEREVALSRQSHALVRANAQIDAALNNMSQGLCMFDEGGRLVVCNQRYLAIYQIPQQLAQPGVSFADLLSHIHSTAHFSGDPDPFAHVRERLAQGLTTHDTIRLRDGRIIEVTNEPMPGGGWVATHDDITERQRSEARIARMARHDSLTDLANRVLFRERADEALQRYHATGKGYTILVFDLDLFKAVNDSLGHPVGDALLKSISARIQSVVVQPDTAGRLGGDEFAILQIAGTSQREDATCLAERLLAAIQQPHHIDGHRILVGTSIGIAMAPDHGLSAEDLLKNADVALYRAKSEGRSAYRFFEPEMDRELRLRRAIEVDLGKALSEGQFEAYYQPLVNADDGMICSVEALIRWHRPHHGIVTPDRFIPVAEERGLITAIDRWID